MRGSSRMGKRDNGGGGMNKRIQKLIAPGTRLFLLVMAAFAAASYILGSHILAYAEAGVTIVLAIYTLVDARIRRRQLVEYIESVTYDAESAKNNTLMNFPLPIVVFRMENTKIIWGNQNFFGLFEGQKPSVDTPMDELVPGFSQKWLTEGKSQCPGLVEAGGRKYQIHGNIVRSHNEKIEESQRNFMGITYWVDVTEFDNIKLEYNNSRPVIMLLVVDNYDELMKNLTDRAKADLMGLVEDRISLWCEGKRGYVQRYDRDRYIFLLESRWMEGITAEKFSILEKVHEVVNASGIQATLSIGVGRDGGSFEENYSFANLSLEMALSRGGDQAVIKNRFNFEFFGGRGADVGSRSKVKSRVTANALAELIRVSSQVLVMGHKLADMDAVGAAVGMACICRKLGVESRIVIDPVKNVSKKLIESVKTMPEYAETFITPEEAIVRADNRTLLIVVDTNRPEQVESLPLLESCNRVAVVDHHRRAASYIQNAALTFHEMRASSACELVSELIQELLEPKDVSKTEAEAMLAGITLDTKNFVLRTNERTFDAAAFLRRLGADPLAAKRFMQSDMEHTVERYGILQGARVYRDGVALVVCQEEQDRVVAAQAADELLNISGISASFVIYATKAGGVVVSGRSIGEVNVQLVLEKLGGGGNQSAAGAQIADTPLQDAVRTLCASIDEYLDNG